MSVRITRLASRKLARSLSASSTVTNMSGEGQADTVSLGEAAGVEGRNAGELQDNGSALGSHTMQRVSGAAEPEGQPAGSPPLTNTENLGGSRSEELGNTSVPSASSSNVNQFDMSVLMQAMKEMSANFSKQQAELRASISKEQANISKDLGTKFDKQAEVQEKISKDLGDMSTKLDKQSDELKELSKNFSDLKLEVNEKIERQSERIEQAIEQQNNKIDQLSARLDARVDEQIATCSARMEKQKEVVQRQQERIELTEARLDSIQELVQGVRSEVEVGNKELGERVCALEKNISENPVSDEQLRTALDRVNEANRKELKTVTEKVSVLASTVEQIAQRQEIASDRTVPTAVGEAAEVRELLNFRREQVEINQRNRERFSRLYENRNTPEETDEVNERWAEREGQLTSKRKRAEDVQQRELEERLRRLRGEDGRVYDRSPVRRTDIDEEECRRHFVSVQTYTPFPGENNLTHPKVWLSQFDHSLPDSWGDELKIKFVMSHMRGEEAEIMRSKECRSYVDFKATFLEEFWSRETQARVKQNILMKDNYNDKAHGSPLDYFRGLVRANQHLDEPYNASQLIGICVMKLPNGLRRDITIAGRGRENIKEFQQLLQELGADRKWSEPQQVVHFVQNPPQSDSQNFSYNNNNYNQHYNNGRRNGGRRSNKRNGGHWNNGGRRREWNNTNGNATPAVPQNGSSSQQNNASPASSSSSGSSNASPENSPPNA